MSEGGERTCPLCAEEMDLTDQHLKPCKCGYEICVWCWHQIMDMAEKDETEGRCPACRMPYNKEKVVGMTAKCEKLVSEMNVEKKLKSQKGRIKSSEGRKQLGSVRVIQRNLVYVAGLALNFADEDLLQRKEYFAQYGKVLKVSISRTAAGAIQHNANSTCSLYVTYSKEEEAIRCIQSVNGFVLDGRPLRACFGTTKYCHAWLRNMPCSNPDCLYLHEIGSQDDSFTKDEAVSAYTRTRVQQFSGATNNMQRRTGNVLPPPADECCCNSSTSPGKLIDKAAMSTNLISASSACISPTKSSHDRSTSLSTGSSGGTRASDDSPFSASTPCSDGPLKSDMWDGPSVSPSEVECPGQVSSLQSDTGKKPVPCRSSISQNKSEMETVPLERVSNTDCINSKLDSSPAFVHPTTLPTNEPLQGLHTSKSLSYPSKMVDSNLKSSGPALDQSSIGATDRNMNNLYTDFLSMSIHDDDEKINIPVIYGTSGKVTNITEEVSATNGLSDCGLRILPQERQVNLHETEDDLLSFDNQRIKDPEVIGNRNHTPDVFNSFHLSNHSNIPSPFNTTDGHASVLLDPQTLNKKKTLIVSASSSPIMSNGHNYNFLNIPKANDVEYSNSFATKDKKLLRGGYVGEVDTGSGNVRENSIISNILSMDFDSLNESLTSHQNLSKFLCPTDKHGAFGVSSPWKSQSSNQSRFSFAREDDPRNQISHFERSIDYLKQDVELNHLENVFSNQKLLSDKFVPNNDFCGVSGTHSDVLTKGDSHMPSNRISISRSQVSAPPGFSMPGISPPPGFSSYERTDKIFDNLSPRNHMLDTSPLARNQWQTPPSSNAFINGDIEFMDPAILEVRHGTVPGGISSPNLDMRSFFPPQLNTYEEAGLQTFIQRSNPLLNNQIMYGRTDNFSSIGDGYGARSRLMEQKLVNKVSPFSQLTHSHSRNIEVSNGQWNGWNEGLGGSNLSVAELLSNERLGFNKFYGGYEESKVGMPSSGNMYNGDYGF